MAQGPGVPEPTVVEPEEGTEEEGLKVEDFPECLGELVEF